MSTTPTRHYRIRFGWRLPFAFALSLFWGVRAAKLVVGLCGAVLSESFGPIGLGTLGIATAVSVTVGLTILIDWSYWCDEPTPRPETDPLFADCPEFAAH